MAGLSDAFNSAIDGLQNNFSTNIVNGTNPLSQPQVTSLFGFNIPGVPLISTRDYFLLQMSTWLTSIPLQTQWIALIDAFPKALNRQFLQSLERVDGGKKGYDINIPKTVLTSYPFQKVIGCLFAQGATIPGETVGVEDVSVANNRGFIPGVVSTDRRGYAGQLLSLNFLETNTSIIDLVFRPWVMLVEHQGLVALPGDSPNKRDFNSLKCNITIMFYNRTYQNVSQVPRKVFTFYNCAPVQVNQTNISYGDEPGYAPTNVVNFCYTNYTVENNMYLPLANIIQSVQNIITTGNIPTISPLQNSQNFPTNPAAFF